MFVLMTNLIVSFCLFRAFWHYGELTFYQLIQTCLYM